MPLPKVSLDCLHAQLESITRFSPDEFLANFVADMVVSNRDLLIVMTEIADKFGDDDDVKMKMLAFASVVLKCVEAQIDAIEFEEQFGDGDITA